MKLISARLALALLVFATTVLAQSNPTLTDKGWPRTFTSGATSFAVYQPQIEQWQDNKFAARSAVAVTTATSKQPAYGVIWFSARIEIDKLNRLVTMTDFVITKASFPASPERAAVYQSALQTQAPRAGQVIALDRLLAELAIAQNRQTSAGHQLKNDPPNILFSTRPAINT
ncbi:MAG: hypothetical protein HOP19_27250, partial [Acidobacteria bacterium]|nr:hypothetical protein [Acidobacteriota bacterium]